MVSLGRCAKSGSEFFPSRKKAISYQFASCARSIQALLVSPGSEARNSVDSFHRLPSPSMNWMNQYGEFIFR